MRIVALLLLITVACSRLAFADDLQDGLDLIDKGEHESARLILEPLANGGNEQAQYQLSEIYRHRYQKGTGNEMGAEDDAKQAKRWLTLSAQSGYPQAQYQLGNHYYRGVIFKRDTKRAKQLWETAVAGGVGLAAYNLGGWYRLLENNSNGKCKAIDWYQRAEQMGVSEASYALQEMDANSVSNECVPTTLAANDQASKAGSSRKLFGNRGGGSPSFIKTPSLPTAAVAIPTVTMARPKTVTKALPKPVVMRSASTMALGPTCGLDSRQEWLMGQPPGNYTIQLIVGSSCRTINKFLAQQKGKSLEPTLYRFKMQGRTLYGLVNGSYSSEADATRAARSLGFENWVRKLKGIHSRVKRN